MGKADDAVERRADLVAHLGQEVGTGLGHRLRFEAGCLAHAGQRAIAIVVEGQAVAQDLQAVDELGDLVAAPDVEWRVEAAGRDRLEGRQHLPVQRGEHEAAQEMAGDGEDDAGQQQAAEDDGPDDALGQGGEFLDGGAAGDDPARRVQGFEDDMLATRCRFAGFLILPGIFNLTLPHAEHLGHQVFLAVDAEFTEVAAFLEGMQQQLAKVFAWRGVDDVVIAAVANLQGAHLRLERGELLVDVDADTDGADHLAAWADEGGIPREVLTTEDRNLPDVGLTGQQRSVGRVAGAEEGAGGRIPLFVVYRAQAAFKAVGRQPEESAKTVEPLQVACDFSGSLRIVEQGVEIPAGALPGAAQTPADQLKHDFRMFPDLDMGALDT